MRSRRVLLVSLAVLALVGLACGGDSKSANLAEDDPKAAMANASKRTADAKTVKLSLSAVSSTNVKVLSGTGSYDFVSQRGRFKLETTLGAGADLLITPTEVFVKVPKKTNPTDPTWIRLTEADVAGAAAGSAQFIESIRKQVDPRTTLDALGANVPDLEKVGEQKIRGTDTTHLRGQVDLSDKAIAAAPAAQQEGLRAAQKVFGADGYPVDVWLDAQGRVRRVAYDVTSGEGAAKQSTTVTLDLYAFGEAGSIELPDPAEVGDASTFLTTTTTPK